MQIEAAELAFRGAWDELLSHLRRNLDLVNAASAEKGYAPLHQAAWHGAPLPVIGELLAMGADRSLTTLKKRQTACQIAAEKHPNRLDLQFLLDARPRTLSQIMRKVLADHPDLFADYDGNRVIFDRIVECLGFDICLPQGADIERRLEGAFQAVTGFSLKECTRMGLAVPEGFHSACDPEFWQNRFLPILLDCVARSSTTPLEKEWTVVGDLFYPAPVFNGFRGDPFLFMEMAQALCHVPLPLGRESLAQTLSSAFRALTGEELGGRDHLRIARFERGGMSSGGVTNPEISTLLDRSDWLRESWQRHLPTI